jgi:protein SCO1/2
MMSPRFWPTALSALAALLVLGAAASHFTLGAQAWTTEDLRRYRIEQGLLRLPPTLLLDAQGRQQTLFTAASQKKTIWLVDFVYMRCPTVCLLLGSEFQRLQTALLTEHESRIRLLSVSFDQARDSVSDLDRYADMHRADAKVWSIAVPTTATSTQTLLQAAQIVVIPDGRGGFAHNAAIHVVDDRGHMLAAFDYDRYEDALAFAHELLP